MPNDPSRRLSRRTLTTSALWSLAAQALPAVVGVVTIPFVVRGLGVDRFGLLAISWTVIGYFSLFDLGLGRAITKLAAESIGSANHAAADRLLWTAWYLMLAVGVAGGGALALLVPWLAGSAFQVPVDLRHESEQMLYLLAGAVPVVVLSAGFRGLLEGAQRFELSSLVKIPMGVLTFLAPLAVLRFTASLPVIVLVLIVVRVAGAVAYALMCHRAVHRHGPPTPLDRSTARQLVGFGAWITVSNVVSPLMVSIDRLFVAAFVSVAAVTYYATPFEAVTKLLLIPGAITAVLFPAFSTAAAIDRTRIVRIFRGGARTLFLAMYPITFMVITFAPELLQLWLGQGFAATSTGVLRWLALGVLMNSLAALPFALLQGVGRSDTTAKIHLIEAPFYVLAMIWLIRSHGITGAAIAWCARTTIDMALLYWQAGRHMSRGTEPWGHPSLVLLTLVPLLGAGLLVESTWLKLVLATALALVFGVVAARWLVPMRPSPDDPAAVPTHH